MKRKPDINARHVRLVEALDELEGSAINLVTRLEEDSRNWQARSARVQLAKAAMAYAAAVRGLARTR